MQTRIQEKAEEAQKRFDQLLRKAEKSTRGKLPFEELQELGWLYRHHAAKLAKERARGEDDESIRTLNALCVRGYSFLYSDLKEKHQKTSTPFHVRASQVLGQTWRAQLLSWALLFMGGLIGATLVSQEPNAMYALIPEGLGYNAGGLERLAESPEARAEFLKRQETPAGQNMFFGSWLFTHNTKIGLLAFATGMLAGIPTVLLQLYNGIVLGALSSLFFRDSWPIDFLAWILPHGVPELTAIVFCTAGGLILGKAIAAPGACGRNQALRQAISPAFTLFLSSIPLFLLAAGIESFVRESTLSTQTRLVIAGINALFLFTFLAFCYRSSRQQKVEVHWLQDLIAPVRNAGPGTGSTPNP